jgi:hypothetical protein
MSSGFLYDSRMTVVGQSYDSRMTVVVFEQICFEHFAISFY